jgi:hypothetical protein
VLNKLINKCGNKFMSLRKAWDENGNIISWIVEGDTDPVIVTIGDSPEDAVAKLITELNK